MVHSKAKANGSTFATCDDAEKAMTTSPITNEASKQVSASVSSCVDANDLVMGDVKPEEEEEETEIGNAASSRGISSEGPQPIFEAELVDNDLHALQLRAVSKDEQQREGMAIENVVMDEEGEGTINTPPRRETLRVEATPLKPTRAMWQNRRLQLIAAGLVLTTIAATLGIVFGIQNRRNEGGDDMGETSVDLIGITKESFARDILPDFTQAALDDPLSDQALALDWLWKDPNSTAALPLFRRIQRFALAVNFFAATELRTPETYQQSGWLTDAHECTWPQNLPGSAVCRDGRLIVANLASSTLIRGTIPPEIGLLTDLLVYEFSHTSMRGSIPTYVGLLSKSIDQFLLKQTRINGPIPSEFGTLHGLLRLNLSGNSLTSSFPTELCQLKLIQALEVHGNALTGTLPSEIGQLSQALILLSVHTNSFTGSLPSEIGAITTLEGFANVATNMTGTLPTELGRLVHMEEFYCNNTLLTGTIPTQMQSMNKMTMLALHDTLLTGTYPLCNLVESGTLTGYSVPCEQVRCSCECSCHNISRHARARV